MSEFLNEVSDAELMNMAKRAEDTGNEVLRDFFNRELLARLAIVSTQETLTGLGE